MIRNLMAHLYSVEFKPAAEDEWSEEAEVRAILTHVFNAKKPLPVCNSSLISSIKEKTVQKEMPRIKAQPSRTISFFRQCNLWP